MSTFRAILTSKDPSYQSQLVHLPNSELQPSEVEIQVHYSSLNYKDALAITGRGAILKKFPLVPGIDASGVVLKSKSPNFVAGQKVLVTGCGLGESQNGGFAECVHAPGSWVVALPAELTTRDAMILGTAGFTAALSLSRMLQMNQTPHMGPIAITGASGGVGSIAVQLFSKAGFDVVAVTGKSHLNAKFKKWGAKDIQSPADLQLGSRPLESVRFGGVVDNVGGELLAKLIRHTQLWGNIASVGLAESSEIHTTVMPFILRGVSLLGISSANCPTPLRHQIWQKLAREWRPPFLEDLVSEVIPLEKVLERSQDMLDRKSQGRTLVQIAPPHT